MNQELRPVIEQFIVWSPFGKKLGLITEEIEEDRVKIRMPYTEDHTTLADVVHGGAIAALVDSAATAAFWSSPKLPENPRGTTIGFTISYLNAARASDLVATAEVIRRGGSVMVGNVDVHDDGGNHVARATVTYKMSGDRPKG